VDWSGALVAGFRLWDQPGNAAPSLHAALALVTVMACWRRWPSAACRGLTVGWLGLVLWSCVALRQHTMIDLGLGLAVAAISVTIVRRTPEAA